MTNRNDAFRLTSLSDPPHGPSLTASCAYPRAAEVGCGTCLFPFARFVPTSGGGSGAGQWRGTSGTAAGCPRVRLGPRLHTVSPGTARGSPHAQWRGTSGTAAGCLGSVSDRGCVPSLRVPRATLRTHSGAGPPGPQQGASGPSRTEVAYRLSGYRARLSARIVARDLRDRSRVPSGPSRTEVACGLSGVPRAGIRTHWFFRMPPGGRAGDSGRDGPEAPCCGPRGPAPLAGGHWRRGTGGGSGAEGEREGRPCGGHGRPWVLR